MTTNNQTALTTETSIFPHTDDYFYIGDRKIRSVIKHNEPLVIELENVLSDGECDKLILFSQTQNRLQRSKIGTSHQVNDIRTSSGMFFEHSENELISTIEQRVSAIMGIPLQHAEKLQILNYAPGQQYKDHYDYFTSPTKKADNRISTLIMYLNDVEEGGETTFPKLNLSVPPRKGNALYFEYFYNDTSLNELTLHAGLPVVKGEKWVATQWMRKQTVR